MNRSVSDSSEILGRLVDLHVIVHRTDVLEPPVLFKGGPQIRSEESFHEIVRDPSVYMTVNYPRMPEIDLLGQFHRRTFIHDKSIGLPMSLPLGVPEEPPSGISVLFTGHSRVDQSMPSVPYYPDICLFSSDFDRHGICVPFGTELYFVLLRQLPELTSETPHPFYERDMTPADLVELQQSGANLTIRHFVSGEECQGNRNLFWRSTQSFESANLGFFTEFSITDGTFEHLGSGGGETIPSPCASTAVWTYHGGPVYTLIWEDLYVCLWNYQTHQIILNDKNGKNILTISLG